MDDLQTAKHLGINAMVFVFLTVALVVIANLIG